MPTPDKLDQVIKNLRVVAENIRAEAVNQPILFLEAARYRVDCMRRTSKAKAMREAWESQAWLAAKKKIEARGDRATLDLIKMVMQKEPEFEQHRAAVDEAEAQEELSKLILTAYRQRRDAVIILADAEGMETSKAMADMVSKEASRKLSMETRKVYEHRNLRRSLLSEEG